MVKCLQALTNYELPMEIWTEILSYFHNSDSHLVCKNFNVILSKNRITFLKNNMKMIKHRHGSDWGIEESVKDMFDGCGEGELFELRSNYVTINTYILNYNENREVYRYYNYTAIVLRVPGGRCAWINYKSSRHKHCREIAWVVNNTEWDIIRFITYCTLLMSDLLTHHSKFFIKALTAIDTYIRTNNEQYVEVSYLYPIRNRVVEEVFKSYPLVVSNIVKYCDIEMMFVNKQSHDLAMINFRARLRSEIKTVDYLLAPNYNIFLTLCERLQFRLTKKMNRGWISIRLSNKCVACEWVLIRIGKNNGKIIAQIQSVNCASKEQINDVAYSCTRFMILLFPEHTNFFSNCVRDFKL